MSKRSDKIKQLRSKGRRLERDEIIDALAAMKDELRLEGVVQAVLFGSVARGTHVEGQSDIDIAVRFDEGTNIDALDVVRIKQTLSDRFGAPVDLVELPARNQELADEIEKDSIRAF